MRMTLAEYMETIWDKDTAFIGIDLQNDFGHMNKGTLYVKGAEEVIEVANDLVTEFSEGLVFWTKDCHPANHCSFTENGGLWPVHCVKGKWGFQFMRGLDINKEKDVVILKGTAVEVDSYSAFLDNDKETKTDLGDILSEEEVKKVFIMGLATDYCVKFSVLDALDLDLEVAVYLPGCRGVEAKAGDIKAAIDEMEDGGAIIIEE